MSYHPIIGISIFFFVLIIAFLIGRSSSRKIIRKPFLIVSNRKKSDVKSDSISPDANWID